jgi:hypothetical protein
MFPNMFGNPGGAVRMQVISAGIVAKMVIDGLTA